MKAIKRIASILIFMILFAVPAVFADEPETDINKWNEVIATVNSGDVPAVISLIESGRLDELCSITNGYDRGCTAVERTAIIITGKNYDNPQIVADKYAAACIITSDSIGVLEAYLDSGFMWSVIGDDVKEKYNRLSDADRNYVLKQCKTRDYGNLNDFRTFFDKAVANAMSSNTNSGSGGGGGIRIYEQDGTLPRKIDGNKEYKIEYYCGGRDDSVVVFAAYDGDGRMTNVAQSSVTDDYREIFAKLSADGVIKLFRLESLENLIPNGVCDKMIISEYLANIKDYEGVVSNISGESISLDTDGGETMNFNADFPVYRYIGHRVKITALYNDVYEISDAAEYETVEFKSTDIESVSPAEIRVNGTAYPISRSIEFYCNGSLMSVADFPGNSEYILSRRTGDEDWSIVNILSYRSDIVDYSNDGTIRGETDYFDTILPHTEIVLDGEIISAADIKPGDVISYCDRYKICVSRDKVNGKAAFEDDGLTVGGRKYLWYDTVIACKSYYSAVTAYLDMFGNVVKAVPDMTAYKPGFVTRIYSEDDVVYADCMTVDGNLIKRRMSGEVVMNGERVSAETLLSTYGSEPLYANMPEDEDASVIFKTGITATLSYNSAIGQLSTNGIITDETAGFFALRKNAPVHYTREELKELCTDGYKYSAIVFFDYDNNINPKLVCFTSELSKQKNMIVTENDGITVSGYVDGEKVTYKLSESLMGSDAAACMNCYAKIKYSKDEIVGLEIISELDGNEYKEVSQRGDTFTCGTVIRKGNGYLSFGNSAYESSIAQITADTDFYTYDGNKVEKSGIGDITADPRGELGSVISFMHVNSRGIAETVVVRKYN